MQSNHSCAWQVLRPLRWTAAAISVLTCVTGIHAGTQIAPAEGPDMGTSIEPAPSPSSDMALDPIAPLPLRRIDPQDFDTASDLDALTRLADSPAAQSPGPTVSSARLAAGNAAWTLGLIYLHGAGVPQDPSLAHRWFERALALGEQQALAGLAWCAIEGCDGPPVPSRASQWTGPLRAVNRPLALYLEWLALDRLAPLRTARPHLQAGELEPPLVAPRLLSQAARAGNVHALIELGLNAVARQRPDQALKFFRQAAGRSAIAAANAAIVADNARPQKEPRSDASKVAAELLAQAQRFHRGDGVSVNYAEAIRLYRLAEAKGSIEAGRMLALIYSKPLRNGNVDTTWVAQLSELDLTRSTPGLRTPTTPRQLQRERTALIDQLPQKWRDRIL